jgi:predicted nuclease of predicted toxin-antitoxin system
MKFLADMGISQTTVMWLKERGFDVLHVRDFGLHRASDTEIVLKAKKSRIVLTCDLDFGNIMAASKERCPSIVIFRLENETPHNVIKRLQQVLNESSEALLKGSIISVEETRHRVRLLPL